ncbi:hypothetical protein ACE1CI_02840 [Aerosakkonemataceae cyanobacterium BLCC-F50]|uniref:Uncharacterized protein n=1 Tax=Floridaenema flaviceps BLCC-F50 TaxID=3153642 RepID=A0ABV4XJH5_9CYAN
MLYLFYLWDDSLRKTWAEILSSATPKIKFRFDCEKAESYGTGGSADVV